MKDFKNCILTVIFLLLSVSAFSQIQNPVSFSVKQNKVSPTEVDVVFNGTIDSGWHVYSTNMGNGGPTSATINMEKSVGVTKIGGLQAKGKEIKEFDKLFNMQVRYFKGHVQFVQKLRITAKTYHIKGYLEYGACNDRTCMPPTSVEFDYQGDGPSALPVQNNEKNPVQSSSISDSVRSVRSNVVADSAKTGNSAMISKDNLWKPVVKQLQQFNGDENHLNDSWLYIFFMGFLGGLLALFTPCVWPIIPMTVSFFLKRSKDKVRGVRDAITYGVSIIVIYLALGLAITAIFGASSLNALATSAVFNIFFCLLLIVFALSFFGWFEITLPSSWSNSVDSKASATSGLLSIFLMAFTLTLVSFSCTGPIIGFLLVGVASTGDFAAPAIGMFGFALALALPFTLFAMFPTWLKSAPKSGSWMNTIKVVLGFIELAFSLKFFSVADLAYGWHLMDREVFLALWIVIFGLLGLYLIGKLKFQSDLVNGEDKPMPVPCIMLGMVSLAFAVYMIPGLWGAPCKAISAFAPPMNTQDFNLNKNEVHARYTDYEEGMAVAAAEGKPVLVDFTGFGCVNCRKMEAAVWTDPGVADILTKNYILISLYVDDKTRLPQPMEITENGEKRTLRTIGDKWSYLQRSKFGANAQPFYVSLDNHGNPLAKSYSYDESIDHYMKFLNQGLDNYNLPK
jgi:thiol:disulfide interchange protein DsbD